ncbi:MAG TPA: DUF4129 domain-containing protein [Pseudonocardiaceae bacterium]|nr:DUF4129 domain-containing protein [Pseudonocardiaceae bacterium]
MRSVRGRVPALLALAALLLLAVVATRGASAVPHGKGLVVRGGSDQGHLSGPGAQQPVGHVNDVLLAGVSSFVVLVLIACLVGMVMILGTVATVRLRRRRRAVRQDGAADEEFDGRGVAAAMVLLRGARAALVRLRQRAGGPPSDAVQEAWLVLEEAAAESGTARRPEQTSTEFTAVVLAAHDVDPGALATLRALYQRARFGRPEAVTDADAERAIDALDRIADTLTVLARPVMIGTGTDHETGPR